MGRTEYSFQRKRTSESTEHIVAHIENERAIDRALKVERARIEGRAVSETLTKKADMSERQPMPERTAARAETRLSS